MEKKLGYGLLACGLGVIYASAVMAWKMFYGGMQPPQVFSGGAPLAITLPSGMAFSLPPQAMHSADLSLGFLLMFFLAGVGGRVGSLGVQLINGGRREEAKASAKENSGR
ncbi:MAG: hypothetical protein M0025_01560 [Elusimicrobia bacterium]|nr:hypothetical protein [Elusimicrobiota bacterium]